MTKHIDAAHAWIACMQRKSITTTASYYESTSMQYLEIFSSLKIEILIEKKSDIFKIMLKTLIVGTC